MRTSIVALCAALLAACGGETPISGQDAGTSTLDATALLGDGGTSTPDTAATASDGTAANDGNSRSTDAAGTDGTIPSAPETITIQAKAYIQNIGGQAAQPAWTIRNDSILAHLEGSNGDVKGDGQNRAVYEITFSQPGTYHLYFEGRVATAADGEPGAEGVNDSFFLPANLTETVPTALINGFDGYFSNKDGGNRLTDAFDWYIASQLQYQVQASDTGKTHFFSVGTREDGMVLRTLVLSQDQDWLNKLAQ